MDGPRGIRHISLDFFTSDHRLLFEFASRYTYSCDPGREFPWGVSMTDESIASRLEYTITQLSVPIPAPIPRSNIWSTVRRVADDRAVRAVHPFYNHQMVWVSDISSGLQAWLDNGEAQLHFLVGTQGDDDIRSHMHRTPIEAAIDSMFYGWGTWMCSDRVT